MQQNVGCARKRDAKMLIKMSEIRCKGAKPHEKADKPLRTKEIKEADPRMRRAVFRKFIKFF